MEIKSILGKDLKVGDVIEVWWSPRQDTIISLKEEIKNKYFPYGFRIASFLKNKAGMSIDQTDYYKVISRTEENNDSYKKALDRINVIIGTNIDHANAMNKINQILKEVLGEKNNDS